MPFVHPMCSPWVHPAMHPPPPPVFHHAFNCPSERDWRPCPLFVHAEDLAQHWPVWEFHWAHLQLLVLAHKALHESAFFRTGPTNSAPPHGALFWHQYPWPPSQPWSSSCSANAGSPATLACTMSRLSLPVRSSAQAEAKNTKIQTNCLTMLLKTESPMPRKASRIARCASAKLSSSLA